MKRAVLITLVASVSLAEAGCKSAFKTMTTTAADAVSCSDPRTDSCGLWLLDDHPYTREESLSVRWNATDLSSFGSFDLAVASDPACETKIFAESAIRGSEKSVSGLPEGVYYLC